MLNLNLAAGDADHSAITEAQLAYWLATAEPGDRIAYHRGFLGLDRCHGFSTLPTLRRQELHHVAGRAFDAAMQGRAHAVQRRNDTGDFIYLLIARSRKDALHRRRHAVFPSTASTGAAASTCLINPTSQELVP